MGVVTVIGDEGVQVLVEFVGGPRDGKRSFAVASTDIEGKPIPPSGFASDQLNDGASPNEVEAGRYLREGITPDGEALTYVWQPEGAPRPQPAPAPDLATRIRENYARRATAAGREPNGGRSRRALLRPGKTDRRS